MLALGMGTGGVREGGRPPYFASLLPSVVPHTEYNGPNHITHRAGQEGKK